MAVDNVVFPEADAWAATIPDMRAGFAVSAVRQPAAAEAKSGQGSSYQKFAAIDLTNLGS